MDLDGIIISLAFDYFFFFFSFFEQLEDLITKVMVS